jgi:hypothetical protein
MNSVIVFTMLLISFVTGISYGSNQEKFFPKKSGTSITTLEDKYFRQLVTIDKINELKETEFPRKLLTIDNMKGLKETDFPIGWISTRSSGNKSFGVISGWYLHATL